jgi:hypothetical protein
LACKALEINELSVKINIHHGLRAGFAATSRSLPFSRKSFNAKVAEKVREGRHGGCAEIFLALIQL